MKRSGRVVGTGSPRLWVLIVATMVSLWVASGATVASAAVESRLTLGSFGPDGSGESLFPEPHNSTTPNQMAFDQLQRKLVVVQPNGDLVIQFRAYAGRPTVPLASTTISGLQLGGAPDVAVDNSAGAGNGRIYVLSDDANRVFGYASSGTELGGNYPLEIPAAEIAGLAVDSTGRLWIGDRNTDLIKRYEANGAPAGLEVKALGDPSDLALDSKDDLYAIIAGQVWKYSGPEYESRVEIDPVNTATPTAIAVDPGTGNLLVARTTATVRLVNEYDNAGSEVAGSPFTVEGLGPPNFRGVAVDGANGIVYLSDVNNHQVFAFTRFGIHPDVTTGAASEQTDSTARLSGTVNPNGTATSCEFEYGIGTTYGQVVPCETSPGSGNGAVEVHADISGLSPSTVYHFRLDATNATGTLTGEDAQFSTFGPPAISETAFTSATASEATVSAKINPGNQLTTYLVEYGPTEAYGQSTAEAQIDAGPEDVRVVERITGLQPDTAYHFRFVAENAASEKEGQPSRGPDAVLKTYPPLSPPEANCPNQQFRTGLSARLPDCRAYELVTPVESNGFVPAADDIAAGSSHGNFATELVTEDGEGVLFDSLGGALPGLPGAGTRNVYEARRGATGWQTRLVGPSGAEISAPEPGGASADHGHQFFSTSNSPTGSLLIEGGEANYVRSADGSFSLTGRGGLVDDPRAQGRWIAPGGAHIIFTSKVHLTEGSPPNGTEAVYDRTPESLEVLSPFGGEYQGASANGATVAFRVGATLHVRHGGIDLAVANGGPTFAGLSANGSRLFYLKGGDIFAYDVQTGTPMPISSGGAEVVNVSADGSHLYFVSAAEQGGEGEAGKDNLYVWAGSVPRFIAVLDPADISGEGFEGSTSDLRIGLTEWVTGLGVTGGQLGEFVGPANDPSRTTPDGRVLVFQSHAQLTSYENNDRSEVYRYDADNESLVCVSCSPVGATAASEARLQVPGAPLNALLAVRNLSEDGTRVFFETGDALVPQDTDGGAYDVYQWDTGEGGGQPWVALISSGHSPTSTGITLGNFLYGASPDGRDVFLLANDPLAPQAGEGGSLALYDARVGGGFAPPAPPLPCQGDACQGEPSGAPRLLGAASATFQGPASPDGRAATDKKKRKGKKHQTKKHSKKRQKSRRQGKNAHHREEGR